MLFEISNDTTGRKSHCGVLEFIADEGVVYMPHWVIPIRTAFAFTAFSLASAARVLHYPPFLAMHDPPYSRTPQPTLA